MIETEKQEFLTGLFEAAVTAADAHAALSQNLPSKPKGRTVVIGARGLRSLPQPSRICGMANLVVWLSRAMAMLVRRVRYA